MKYRVAKVLSILISPLFLWLAIYGTMLLGKGDTFGWTLYGLSSALSLIDAWLFYYIIEHNAQRRK